MDPSGKVRLPGLTPQRTVVANVDQAGEQLPALDRASGAPLLPTT
jgi:hypothetical protein